MGQPQGHLHPHLELGEVVGAEGAGDAAGAAVLAVSPVQDGESRSGMNLFPHRLY